MSRCPKLQFWRLPPIATALLIASPAYAIEVDLQVITANPLGSEQLALPNTVLTGDKLTLAQRGSLG